MALELVYTSASKGLRAGTSGFCTVAMTRGLPPALVPRLEALGGYRPGPSGDGPVAFAFWRIDLAGSIAHVLSVVGPAPPDHTQRTNKIATYVVLGADELVPAGPAWLLGQPGLLRRAWKGEPAWIEAPVRVPASGAVGPRVCSAWMAACGDAGWAGTVASAFLRDQGKPIHVIVPASLDPLPLADEVICLLPDWARWRLTFSTYFLQPVAGVPCSLRFCLEGTPAADAARQSKSMVVDLVRGPGQAPDGRHARVARTGVDEEALAEARAKQAALAKAAAAKAAAARAKAQEIHVEPAAPEDPAPRRELPRRAPIRTEREAELMEATRQSAPFGGSAVMAVMGIVMLLAVALLIVVVVVPVLMNRNRAADALTDGRATSDAPVAAAEPAPTPPPTHESPPPADPTPPPATKPAPDPTPPPATKPETKTSEPPENTQAPGASAPDAPAPDAPAPDAPAPDAAPHPLLSGRMSGATGVFRTESSDRLDEVVLVWSAPSGTPALASAQFRSPPSLEAFGVLAAGHELRIDGMDRFVADASVRGREVVVRIKGPEDPAPAALASAVRAGPSTKPWRGVLDRCAIEVLDDTGSLAATVGFANERGAALTVDSQRAVVVQASPMDPLVVQVLSGKGRARTVRIERVVMAGTNEIMDATALVTLKAQRAISGDGSLSLSAVTNPDASRRLAEIMQRMTPDLDSDERARLQQELSELRPETKTFDLTVRVALPSGALLYDGSLKLPASGGGR
jgi:hypothetical protein